MTLPNAFVTFRLSELRYPLGIVIAEILLLVIVVYGAVGVLFALFFVSIGLQRLDPAAAGSGWGFRLLTLPGSAALWPLLALRWLRGEGLSEERGPHRRRFE